MATVCFFDMASTKFQVNSFTHIENMSTFFYIVCNGSIGCHIFSTKRFFSDSMCFFKD